MIKNIKDQIYGIGFRRLKIWTRAGLIDETIKVLVGLERGSSVLSVGGFGATDDALEKLCLARELRLVKLDIDARHSPDLVKDLSEKNFSLSESFHAIVALEVFEHISDYQTAIINIKNSLVLGGKIVVSTPWIIPVHDVPGDYHRFTHFQIRKMLTSFSNVQIGYRGDYIDSYLVLGLRGLLSGGSKGKVVFIFNYLVSFLRKIPTIKFETGEHFPDSTIGYFAYGTRSE